MSKLPRISGRDLVAALKKIGFYERRRESSHLILRREVPFAQLVVPDHRELDTGTLRAIVRQAGITVEDLVKLV